MVASWFGIECILLGCLGEGLEDDGLLLFFWTRSSREEAHGLIHHSQHSKTDAYLSNFSSHDKTKPSHPYIQVE